ncbi:unnamed protein product [Rotaria socialis]|uniref:Retrovirus-related Pol polyprotein from transposon TNT 1-94-like beta-barrel domain-containing protein n=1 Tax=Rotaria socialis TaxID=392032 RepID=A0A817WXL3_9BILA|nr:unnamed protein product [Rotaria socialis]CAF4916715.1 unnamed protein product [Rotaria socialis]
MIVDSGSSCHMVPYASYLSESTDTDIPITIANGKHLIGTQRGTLTGKINGQEFKLKNVLYVPGLNSALFSVPASSKDGIKIIFTETGDLILKKDGREFINPRMANSTS